MQHVPRPFDRRRFLGAASAAAVSAAASPLRADEAPVTPGVDLAALLAAERVIGLSFTDAERAQMLPQVQEQREIGELLRRMNLENGEGPAEIFDPRLPDLAVPRDPRPMVRPPHLPRPLPQDPVDVAYASLADLSHWIRERAISCEALATLYLERLRRHDADLHCVITLMEGQALARARALDAELEQGKWRGPLHGLPYGAKDLFDTAGIATTFGAEPWRDRVPERDAAVVRRLDEAGAVLVAKLSLGALAYGDIWFGGTTRNPWNLEQGSSGSSAGSAAAAAAGLVAFALGTETYGSIGSPSARCGATGFRPTFGRVSRAGAMSLCWSLDKVGPIGRSALDCAMVLDAIAGPDPADESTTPIPLDLDLTAPLAGARIGYPKAEYAGRGATDADRATLAALEDGGAVLVEKVLPDLPFGTLIFHIIAVEAAAAFDAMTRTGTDDQLAWQAPEAWPNTFRAARFIPAVEFMQARRLRRRCMKRAAELFADVDALIAPQRHGPLHALTNLTGHPALTLRQEFRADGTPRAVTLWGRLYRDGALLALGIALERALGLSDRRPPGFS